MDSARKSIFTLLLLLALVNLTMVIAKATAETFNVPAGQTAVRTVDLNADDVVFGDISVVSGGESKQVGFTVLGPRGNVVLSAGMVVVNSFSFTAAEGGMHSFVFDNSLSIDDKTVSLNYEVKHYWFGMPQEFVLMLIVVFLGVLGLVIYAMATKR
jgi:hypothetical protein